MARSQKCVPTDGRVDILCEAVGREEATGGDKGEGEGDEECEGGRATGKGGLLPRGICVQGGVKSG